MLQNTMIVEIKQWIVEKNCNNLSQATMFYLCKTEQYQRAKAEVHRMLVTQTLELSPCKGLRWNAKGRIIITVSACFLRGYKQIIRMPRNYDVQEVA